MRKCVETIKKYYSNLEYQNNRWEAQEKLSNLCNTLNFKETDKLSHRFLHTASIMKNNLNTFASVCEHVDVVITIIDYFNFVGATIEIDGEMYNNTLVMQTIGYMYQDYKMQLFLETAILKKSQIQMYKTGKEINMLHLDIILLEDSDLFAVINCLKFRSVANVLNKIWVQESIKETFMWYFKKYFEYDLAFKYIYIHRFQSKQDILTVANIITPAWNMHTVNIISIWSEDITAAKNLAESFKQHILCINTCLDFDAGVILPFTDEHLKSLDFCLGLYDVKKYACANPINPTTHEGVIFDLFYDGKWQTPIKKQYWMHNDILFANATREDIVECAISAKDGFKIWSAMSSKSRMQILLNLANTLENEGKFIFASEIKVWMNFSYICGLQLNNNYVNEKVEITEIYTQRGTVILKEGEENVLLPKKLAINLAFGNSVIVISDPDLYFLAQCCNIFKMCGIPPGVINLLSCENVDFDYDTMQFTSLANIYLGISTKQYMIEARQ